MAAPDLPHLTQIARFSFQMLVIVNIKCQSPCSKSFAVLTTTPVITSL